ncbi:MAG: oxidoreductase, partial [Actinobacteria bacterium]
MSKAKVAAYSAAGCGGCDIAMLEIEAHLLELIEAADIVFWPTIVDLKYADIEAMPDGEIDLTLFNGAIRTEENAHVAKLLRAKSKVLVGFGACSSFGGVVGLGDLYGAEALMARAFSTESTDPGAAIPRPAAEGAETAGVPAMLPRVLPLAGVVPVDYTIPGCPPVGERVWEVLTAFVSGALPPAPAIAGAGDRCVCDECTLPKRNTRVAGFRRFHEFVPEPEWCLLEQGVLCMGPATRSGCGAQCT